MDAKELRIGNLVNEEVLGNCIVSDICEHVVMVKVENVELNRSIGTVKYTLNYGSIKPIPLTKDWLSKFGFKKHKILGSYNIGQFRFHTQRPFGNEKQFNLTTELYYCERAILVSGGVKEVHQIQNLYFALTNKELTIK
jgi:hypothetical protein